MSTKLDTRTAFLAAIFMGCAALSACNTVKGAGTDIESAGEAVQDAAQDVEDDIDN